MKFFSLQSLQPLSHTYIYICTLPHSIKVNAEDPSAIGRSRPRYNVHKVNSFKGQQRPKHTKGTGKNINITNHSLTGGN